MQRNAVASKNKQNLNIHTVKNSWIHRPKVISSNGKACSTSLQIKYLTLCYHLLQISCSLFLPKLIAERVLQLVLYHTYKITTIHICIKTTHKCIKCCQIKTFRPTVKTIVTYKIKLMYRLHSLYGRYMAI